MLVATYEPMAPAADLRCWIPLASSMSTGSRDGRPFTSGRRYKLGRHMGTVESIHVAAEPRAMPEPAERVSVAAGRGIEGDYHFEPHEPGNGDDLTLIAAESIERLAAEHGIWL